MKHKVIIFDLWETLGTKNIGISSTIRSKFNIEKTPDFVVKYENAVQLEEWESQEDMARSFLKAFDVEDTEENIKFIIETQKEGMNKAIMFSGMKELLMNLKKDYKLAILSNTTIFESEVIKQWGIEDLFDAIVFSWQIKSLKPARKNFEEVANRLNVELNECLFIDDSEKNVNTAQEYGLKAIQFKNIEDLKSKIF